MNLELFWTEHEKIPLLKAIESWAIDQCTSQDSRVQMSDAEVITATLVAARFFDINQFLT